MMAPLGSDPTYARGALVLAAVAPGLAPYVAARVGIGNRFEGGVTYTGHFGHIDVRRSFDWADVSLSIGVGLELPIYGDSYASTLPAIELQYVHGYGADVPVLIGWQSAARIYMVWAGVRGGWDHTDLSAQTSEPGVYAGEPSLDLTSNRFYGGSVIGMAAGFRHIHGALELDAAYQSAHGTYNGAAVSVQGFSLAPSAALWFSF